MFTSDDNIPSPDVIPGSPGGPTGPGGPGGPGGPLIDSPGGPYRKFMVEK